MILEASLVVAQGVRPSEPDLLKTEMQVQKKPPIPSFEKGLKIKPLSDEELGQISAAGLGPVMPFPFQRAIFLLILSNPWHGVSLDFVRGSVNPQFIR